MRQNRDEKNLVNLKQKNKKEIKRREEEEGERKKEKTKNGLWGDS